MDHSGHLHDYLHSSRCVGLSYGSLALNLPKLYRGALGRHSVRFSTDHAASCLPHSEFQGEEEGDDFVGRP